MTNHPTNAIPFFIAIILERLAYYGTRSIFMLYLISSTINMNISDAFTTYSWITIILLFSQLGGGLIGLINEPRILTLTGYAIQMVGTILMGFMPNVDGLIIGFFLLVIGSGLSKTNSMALMAQLYQKSKVLDAAVMINYAAINLGAFLGAFIITLIADTQSFKAGFLTCTVLMLLSIIMVFIVSPTPFTEKKIAQKNSSYITTLITIACIAAALFWMCHDYLFSFISSSRLLTSNESLMELMLSTSQTINFILIIITTLFLAFYFTIKRIHVSTLLAVGFGSALLAALLLSFVINGGLDVENIYLPLLLFYVLIIFTEILIGPPLTSYILQKVNLMYIPIVIAGYYSLPVFVTQGVVFIYSPNNSNTISTCLIIFGIATVGFIVMAKMRPKKDQQESFKDQLID